MQREDMAHQARGPEQRNRVGVRKSEGPEQDATPHCLVNPLTTSLRHLNAQHT